MRSGFQSLCPVSCPGSDLSAFTIRPHTATDSPAELLALLRAAATDPSRIGLPPRAADAPTAAPAPRPARRGLRFMAQSDGRLVGSMVLSLPTPDQGCAWYRRGEVVQLSQFALDPQAPDCRPTGARLLHFAQRWVAAQRFTELALDVPVNARARVAWYLSHGFRCISEWQPDADKAARLVLSACVAEPEPSPLASPATAPRRDLALL